MATQRQPEPQYGPELTPEEQWQEFDDYARWRLHISGAEFIRRYDAGEIDVDDPDFHIPFIHLEMMLPYVRDAAPQR